ncbi:hypothetical protein BKX93_10615 [Chromobacterium vaccinii]|uniref:Uncharacterized protein n=1 Tax=Chromobacterium vaccinii TaxID=1108595 RepID=A0A1D9LGK3_9NEIS|nr:hypothetical protein BKX93_10615 [Chromobacterium vaccinii]
MITDIKNGIAKLSLYIKFLFSMKASFPFMSIITVFALGLILSISSKEFSSFSISQPKNRPK